ncbi:MAG: AMP-binding protein [Spirochaetales bacterium]
MAEQWRLIYKPDGDIADLFAYPAALAEGRIAGKYLLSKEKLSDTLVILGMRRKGILAGADVSINKEVAAENNIDVAISPRSGKRGAQPVGTLQFQEMISNAPRNFKAVPVDPEEPAVLLYTSGTTGLPKGVMLSHKNFYSQCSEVVAKVLPLEPTDRVVGVLPLYHVYGLSNGLISTIYFGCTIALIPQYSPQTLLETIQATKATMLIAIPTMYIHLLTLARARKTEMPKTLRYCISGGAPLPLSVLTEFERVFHTSIVEGYGLTETTSAVSLNKSGEQYKPGSIGPASPGVQMKIVNDNFQELPDGEVGEIVIRGNVVTRGYWNNPQATSETIRDGWLLTGDLGYRDKDGYFFITDRKKDLIIRGGYNISPREIEELLFTHPKIEDAAVIGAYDKRQEEIVKAIVVVRAGETLTEKEVIQFCTANLAPYKVPKIVEFRNSLPKSATGKVLKKELREGYTDERLIEKTE